MSSSFGIIPSSPSDYQQVLFVDPIPTPPVSPSGKVVHRIIRFLTKDEPEKRDPFGVVGI